jgi:predicted ATP-dependent endonuclease of OLD family
MENKFAITAFYVENFKAIRKGTWFELNKLNVLTGANSSGKSTLFNAMKIFTEGFVDGDFPVIDISKIIPEAGFFENLLNFNSPDKHIWLGFRYFSTVFNGTLEVKHKFVKGEKNTSMTVAEVVVKLKNKHLLSFYRPSEYAFEIDYRDKNNELNRFVGVDDINDPGEIVFALNLENLAASISSALYQKHEDVFSVLHRNFPNGIWTGELLEEVAYYLRWPYTRISDEIFFDFYNDNFSNLYNKEGKDPLFHDEDQEYYDEYKKLASDIGYNAFIKDYFYDFFNELSAQLRFFYHKKLFHLDLESNIQKRIIDTNFLNFKIANLSKDGIRKIREGEYVEGISIRLQGYVENLDMYNWLKIFDLSGYFITKEIDNGYHQVMYLDDREREINIADLGKGHAKLMQLMLAIGYKLFLLYDEDRGREKTNDQNRPQIIIHIEEPEAYLHPKWQSLLADFFVMLTKKHNVQFLIETHSVYLIQKLQLLVARKEMEPNDISLFYFEQAKKDVGFRRINIRKDGLLKESFGEGFYDESAHLAVSLLEHENLN